MRSLAVLLVLSVIAAPEAQGRDIYVNNTGGDDTFTGRAAENVPGREGPVRTIAKALRLAQSGDRIVLANTGEPYRESISFVGSRLGGMAWQPLTLVGNGAVLDGSAPVPPEAWQHHRDNIFRFTPARRGPQQLFLDDRPAQRVPVDLQRETVPELEPLQWCELGGSIFFCVEPDKLPAEYSLSYAHLQTGITLYHVRWVGILDLTVQGFRVDGISAANSAEHIYLGGVTCRGNGRAGLSVGGASRVELEDCLIGNNAKAQLLTLPWSTTSVADSEIFANTAPARVDRGGKLYVGDQPVEGTVDDNIAPPAG